MNERGKTVWDDPPPKKRKQLLARRIKAMRDQYLPENDAPEDEREAWRRIQYEAAKRLFRDEEKP